MYMYRVNRTTQWNETQPGNRMSQNTNGFNGITLIMIGNDDNNVLRTPNTASKMTPAEKCTEINITAVHHKSNVNYPIHQRSQIRCPSENVLSAAHSELFEMLNILDKKSLFYSFIAFCQQCSPNTIFQCKMH